MLGVRGTGWRVEGGKAGWERGTGGEKGTGWKGRYRLGGKVPIGEGMRYEDAGGRVKG